MSKRGKSKPVRSWKFVVSTWIAAFLSAGLVYLAAVAVTSDLATFRSCDGNSAGLKVVSCGKQSLNFGDIVLIGLFLLSAALLVSLFTAAWRMTRREQA